MTLQSIFARLTASCPRAIDRFYKRSYKDQKKEEHKGMEKDDGFIKAEKSRQVLEDKAIQEYIVEHGFGLQTPLLNKNLSASVFKLHYYEKKELIEFCRTVGIATTGLKNELNARIVRYLETGEISVVEPLKRPIISDSAEGLSLEKVVVNYKSDPITRKFFVSHIPGFKSFSALVQKQIKARLANGEVFTYGDIAKMYETFFKNQQIAKKTREATKVAHDSCEYNQFFIDYSHDLEHKVHRARDAWMLVRGSAGEKTYQRYKEKITEIRSAIKQQAAHKKKPVSD